MKKLKATNLSRIIVVTCFVVGLGIGMLRGLELTLPEWSWPILMAGLFITSAVYWFLIDEAAKEAHKFSWYWGSSIGICLIIVFCFIRFAGLNSIHMYAWLLPDQPTPEDIFFAGAFATIFTQYICYAIVWGFWWLRMR